LHALARCLERSTNAVRRDITMLNLWQAAVLLALDSTRVVNLRTGVLAGGGSDAWAETIS
jgi:hypothetical protein